MPIEHPFARALALGSWAERLAQYPSRPFNLKVSLLPPVRAEAVRTLVFTKGGPFPLQAHIVDGEMWVIGREVQDLCARGHDIHDKQDACCHIPPHLFLDHDELDREREQCRASGAGAWGVPASL